MKRQYRYTFEFKKTEEEARAFCGRINAGLTRYMRTTKPAHFTPWRSQDRKENLFICWYYV